MIQFVPFLSPIVGGHQQPLKGSRELTIPKRSLSRRIARIVFLTPPEEKASKNLDFDLLLVLLEKENIQITFLPNGGAINDAESLYGY